MAYDIHGVQEAVQLCCERLLLPDLTFGRQQGGTQHVLYGALERLVSMYSHVTKRNCKYWSERAVAAHRLNPKATLQIEHVCERVSIVTKLSKAKNAEEIGKALELATTCVVLEEEHRLLPHGVETPTIEAGWERYEQAKIKVVQNPFAAK